MAKKLTDQEIARRNKLQLLRDLNLDPYLIEKFPTNSNSQEFKEKYQQFTKDELHEKTDEIIMAGRVMNLRQTFGVLRDFYGDIQFYVNKNQVTAQELEVFKHCLDIGDIIGVHATPMKTNTGELTLKITKLTILVKALKPLPEKFHGLADEQLRARKRYLDLIVNLDSRSVFIKRSLILQAIRGYMNDQKFLEVETPILSAIAGGASARPFITHHNCLDRDYYLRIATELALKKIVVGGIDRVYEIGRIFRNEGMDTTHNPEFTSIEAYQAYADLQDMMQLCQNIFCCVAKKLNTTKITYKGIEIDFDKPFACYSMVELIKKFGGVDFSKIKTDQQAIELAKKHDIELLPHQKNIGHIISLFFEKYCEDKLLQPTFVVSHPLAISPLAKKDPDNNLFTRRFELFIAGKEYANAFSELNDPIDQLQRFQDQLAEKKMGNDEANDIDQEFIDALEYGMPPTGGLGIGIDRLVMLFTGRESIRDVLLFPHMREQNNHQ